LPGRGGAASSSVESR